MTTTINPTVKDIFNRINGLNASGYHAYGEKFSGYRNPMMDNIARDAELEIEGNLPEGTLASKIYNDRKGKAFSIKQLWVIAYELMKNEAYINKVRNEMIAEEAELHGCTVEEWLADEE